MKLTGSRQRAWFSAWIAAAVLLAVLNARQFISLEQKPLEGQSPALRMLQAKMQQFTSTVAVNNYDLNHRIGFPVSEVAAPTAGDTDNGRPAITAQAGIERRPMEPTALPTLSGIIQAMDSQGSTIFHALLNGKICRIQDEIDGFVVAGISPDGVVIKHSGLTWLIESPKPIFSKDQGE